ncbi:MAG TPA: hypothetical protein VFG01_09435 [Acidobacteriota bacterium]|nr:hypothetical protein [Acidobacteriota bacterium]
MKVKFFKSVTAILIMAVPIMVMASFKTNEFSADMRPRKTQDLDEIQQAVSEKLAENDIEWENEKGTIHLEEINTPVLEEYFPDWKVFHVTRQLKIQGGTSFNYVPVERVTVNEEDLTVLILSSPATNMPLENGLTMIQEQNIQIKSQEDIQNFAPALVALYFKNPEVQGEELRENNIWAVYTGTFFNHLKGFLIEVDSSGKVINLSFKLKIKEK